MNIQICRTCVDWTWIAREISPYEYSNSKESIGTIQLLYNVENLINDLHKLDEIKLKGYNSSLLGNEIYDAFDYIKNNLKEGEKIILYGYSHGGSNINKLAKILRDNNFTVDLLFTVDAYDAITEDAELLIPENVNTNYNYFHFQNSEFTGARGTASIAENKSKTKISNKIIKDSSHGSIDEETNTDVYLKIKGKIKWRICIFLF